MFEPLPAKPILEQHLHAALTWLLAGIDHQKGKGSPAFASRWRYPVQGWSPSYPETTGYLIETLLHPQAMERFPTAEGAARSCANWLLKVQLPSGAFSAGYANGQHPSVFNSAQIVLGLLDAGAFFKDSRFMEAARRTLRWLGEALEPDGSWERGAYVSGFTPAYYTRAIWPALRASRALDLNNYDALLIQGLEQLANRWQPDGSVHDWGFKPGKPAFTHTIAYTLRGMLECAVLLQSKTLLHRVESSAQALMRIYGQQGRLAGAYDVGWKGNYQFMCPTGNAQLAVFMHRLSEETGAQAYIETGAQFLSDCLPAQRLQSGLILGNSFGPGRRDRYGAVPGSVPLTGAYLPLRYPNWAAKFFADALLRYAC